MQRSLFGSGDTGSNNNMLDDKQSQNFKLGNFVPEILDQWRGTGCQKESDIE